MNTAMWLRVLACILASATIACGAHGSSAPAAHRTITLGKEQAGQTIHASVGDTVRVNLDEQFGPVPGIALVWDVSTSAPSVMKLARVTRDPVNRPRIGTVKYTADFTAAKAGEAKLLGRGSQSCEAMAAADCTGQDFTITVVVS